MTFYLSTDDVDDISSHYDKRYRQFGYSPKTLDWDKGKQELRFSILTSRFDLVGRSILDIGCGFGDMNQTVRARIGENYSYLGVDVSQALLLEANARFGSSRVSFLCGDFLSLPLQEVDYSFASGTFNLRLKAGENYEFIWNTMKRAFTLSREGFAFNFLSNKVDYMKGNTFHSAPEKILEFAYKLSRNVVLLNDYMPFEFSIIVRKDDSFDPENTIFRHWLDEHGNHPTFSGVE